MARLIYTGDRLREIAFPLGGIGTGTVSLGGRGNLRDWEIANRPAKGTAPFRGFFALGVDDGSGAPHARVLERELFPPFTGSRGLPVHLAPGLPRFAEVEFTGEYPLAHLDFLDRPGDEPFPLRVALDAFNPMIPGDADASGLPVALLDWTFTNTSDRPVSGLLVAVVSNLVGYQGSPWPGDPAWEGGPPVNRPLDEPGIRGVLMGSERDGGRHPAAGEMALLSPWPATTIQTTWAEQDWPYSLRPFWYQLLGQVPFEERRAASSAAGAANPSVARRPEATLGLRFSLAPGELATLPILIAWRFPNRYVQIPGVAAPRWVGNHYATRFADAAAVARHVLAERDRLETATHDFHRHLFATTLPDPVVDAVSANLSTLRSQTCFRDATGQFYAYEGCNADSGCCPMNCTHVWLYEQALAALYPALERDMRANAFLIETDDAGRMRFRTRTPQTAEPFPSEAPAAADGQMAEVIQLLRDYQVCGDRDFLARLWPKAKLALEHAWRSGGWDADRDGVMEGEQHNTTDIAFVGPNPLMTFLYLAALRAGAAIARELGDPATADGYAALATAGAIRADALLWNGEFYQQRLDLAPAADGPAAGRGHGGAGDAASIDDIAAFVERGTRDASGAPYNQVEDGCLTDQLLGQWLANLVGLGPLVPRERLRAALAAIYRHNFRRMRETPTNFLRAFAVNDERGVLYASFPRTVGQIIPLTAVFRAHEVWSGCEYALACLLIQEGLVEEGQAIVAAIRARHDGAARNPWNEPECGDHYARALASYGLLQAHAGLRLDRSRGRLELAPSVERDRFAVFFAVEGAWGSLALDGASVTVDLGAGELTIRELVVAGRPAPLPAPVTVRAGRPERIELGAA
jgi:uncharacterized protein (DUF608 family)